MLRDPIPVDLVSGVSGVVNIATHKYDTIGPYFDFTGANDNYVKFDITEVSNSQVTIVFRSKFGSAQSFMGIGYSSGDRWAVYNNGWSHYLFHPSSGNFYNQAFEFPTQWVWNVITIDSVNNVSKWYENGVLLGTSTVSIPPLSSANKLSIGSGSYTAYPGNHDISDVFVFNSIFSSAEAFSIMNDPYQFLLPT